MKRQYVKYLYDYISWHYNGTFHREDMPTVYYFKDDKLNIVSYIQHDELHRITGPAIVNYKDKTKRYWYQDREYASLEELLMVEACK